MATTPTLLEGETPEGPRGAVHASGSAGFGLLRVPDASTIHGANGITDYAAKTVSVRSDMSDAAQVKTLPMS